MEVIAFNNSNKPHHIVWKKGSIAFSGRSGHIIKIKNFKKKYTPSESFYAYKYVTIDPGKEKTFRIKFAIGLLQRERDWCGVQMPEKAGEYVLFLAE